MIETQSRNGYTLVKIKIKEANLDFADQFKNEMFELIDKGNVKLMVSFEEVAYVDSSFLGALVSTLKYAMSKQGDVSVIN